MKGTTGQREKTRLAAGLEWAPEEAFDVRHKKNQPSEAQDRNC